MSIDFVAHRLGTIMIEAEDLAELTHRQEPKQAWVKPEVTRISAGEAEFGANPIVPEGAFGTGS